MATIETREKILDTAERLFAQGGVGETSLRTITAEAGVNLAAVNYHFRTKEALLQAVFKRRMEPLNKRRLELLDACARKRPPATLEEILEAIVGPPIRLRKSPGDGGEAFARLFGRAMFEPPQALMPILYREFKDVFLRFADLIQGVLPGAPAAEIFWRTHFLMGAMCFNIVNPGQIRTASGGTVDPEDVDAAVKELVAFAAGGFRAPSRW